MTKRAGIWAYALAGMLFLSPAAQGQEQYKRVELQELLRSPQKFWAKPIVFRDRLLSHTEDDVRLDDRLFLTFNTEELGACYAEESLGPVINQLELNKDYHFSGTVFQHRGRYYIIIQSISGTVDSRSLGTDLDKVALTGTMDGADPGLYAVAVILSTIQSSHFNYARENGADLCALYQAGSPHFDKAMDLARQAIQQYEADNKTIASDVLLRYLVAILGRNCTPTSPAPPSVSLPPPAEPEPAVEAAAAPAKTAPEPAVIETPAPAAEPPPAEPKAVKPAVEPAVEPKPEPAVQAAPETIQPPPATNEVSWWRRVFGAETDEERALREVEEADKARTRELERQEKQKAKEKKAAEKAASETKARKESEAQRKAKEEAERKARELKAFDEAQRKLRDSSAATNTSPQPKPKPAAKPLDIYAPVGR